MEFVDYYKIMGLDDTASADDIKRTYRKLARKYHPDVSKESDAEVRFKEVGEAYQVLKDPERRREYDELKKYGGASGRDFDPPPGWETHAGFDPGRGHSTDNVDFSDFFEQMFGNRSTHRTHQHAESGFAARGQDMHARLTISLRDAFSGATVPLVLRAPTPHDDGSIHVESKTLEVKVPKGISDGQKLRLRGQGGPGLGSGQAGDLYIELNIQSDQIFHLDGKDITVKIPVTPWEAALGDSIQVPTLGGPVKLTIPPNAKNGQKFRLRGRGLPGKTPGDQFVILGIELPQVQTEEQKKLFQDMSTLWSFNPRDKLGD